MYLKIISIMLVHYIYFSLYEHLSANVISTERETSDEKSNTEILHFVQNDRLILKKTLFSFKLWVSIHSD